MNIQDIITLHNAGYTKEDIFKILGNEQKPEQHEQKPEQQPEQSEQKPEQQQGQPEQNPEQQPGQPVSDDRIKQLETKLDYVINRFNYLAVQQSSQPAGKEESLDDILSSVVRGFQKNDDK